MEIKHIRWIAVVGLIAIVELQYVWLVNTYKLTKESIQMKGEELFPEAALQEVFLRVSKTKKDSTVTMNVNFDAEKDMETMSNPGQWLMSYMHVSFQEIALKDFNRDVSFVDLDSIYARFDWLPCCCCVVYCRFNRSCNEVFQSTGYTWQRCITNFSFADQS